MFRGEKWKIIEKKHGRVNLKALRRRKAAEKAAKTRGLRAKFAAQPLAENTPEVYLLRRSEKGE